MSVFVMARIKVDPERLIKLFEDRHDDFMAVKAQAEEAGAIHHMFVAGGGEVIVVDEWDSAESFEQFFDNPTIAEFMAEAGAEGPPEVSVYEVLGSPDRF